MTHTTLPDNSKQTIASWYSVSVITQQKFYYSSMNSTKRKPQTEEPAIKSLPSHCKSAFLCDANILTSSEFVILMMWIKCVYDATFRFLSLLLDKDHIHFIHCVYIIKALRNTLKMQMTSSRSLERW